MESSAGDSPPSSPTAVPGLSGTGSDSHLILLPNTDDRDQYITDDEDGNEDSDAQPGIDAQPTLPLSPSVVFLYLLSPYLRLGAISASDFGDASLANNLVGLVVAAGLSAFCRQIWFLLGRYLRKSSTEDILVYTFARRNRRARKYGLARHAFTIANGSFRLLLATLYLRGSVDTLLLLQVPESIPTPSRLNISIILSILVFVLSLPRSLSSRSIVCTTALSVVSYLAWLIVTTRSHGTNGLSRSNPFQRGVLWNEISSLAFACSTVMTVPLSASFVAGTLSASPACRNARTRSFELLNVFSAVLAASLILPLIVAAASHRPPASTTTSENLMLGLHAATLVFSIPSVIISITSLPPHGGAYRFIRTDLALSTITVTVFALSLVPSMIARIFDDATLLLAVSGTFLLPALAHITIHYFRRPLSIVVPHEPSSTPSTSSPSSSEHPPSPSRDSLLQRKERLLQRSRLEKRLLWDIIIWAILIPLCACAFVWATGRLVGQW